MEFLFATAKSEGKTFAFLSSFLFSLGSAEEEEETFKALLLRGR